MREHTIFIILITLHKNKIPHIQSKNVNRSRTFRSLACLHFVKYYSFAVVKLVNIAEIMTLPKTHFDAHKFYKLLDLNLHTAKYIELLLLAFFYSSLVLKCYNFYVHTFTLVLYRLRNVCEWESTMWRQ